MQDSFDLARRAAEMYDRKQLDEAVQLAERAVQLNPRAARACQILGLVASDRNRPQEAISWLQRALAVRPDLVSSHSFLGHCYMLLGDLDRALHHLNAALRLSPDHRFAHFNRAVAWLKLGRYAEGWLEYEWRWLCGLVARPEIQRPRWDGSPLQGRSILIHTEQGAGDVFQFIRLLPLVRQQGGRVILACTKALQPFLRPVPFVDDWFPVDEPAPAAFDVHSPLLSLPGLLGVDDETIPRAVPYLTADAGRIEHWRERVGKMPGFRVGLCWQGSPTYSGDAIRSIPLRQFTRLAQVPGVTLINLQKGPGIEQIEACRTQLALQVFEDLDQEAAFVDTAALMHHLDLIISADTSIAHLAGALGRPVWVLLSTGCDWRWQVGRQDSPWYPTMRLFRQQSFGDWTTVLDDVAAALAAQAAARQ